MKNPLLVPEFREMIDSGDLEQVKDFCMTTPPAVVADFLGALTPEENKKILSTLSRDRRSRIFSYYDDDVKLSIIQLFDDGELVDLIARMHDEEQLHFLTLFPAAKQKEMRDLAARSRGKEAAELVAAIDQLIKHEMPAGEAMTPDEIAAEIQPLINVYGLAKGAIRKIGRIEKDCWINIVNPTRDDLPLLASYFKIPLDFLTASLDIDETARIETEDNATLIIIKIPYFDEQNPDLPYVTLPIGIIRTGGLLITVCQKDEMILRDFIEGRIKNITTINGVKFILQIIMKSLMLYLQYLKQINNAANMIQKKLEQESKNKQLIKLMNLEKCLVYFTTSLRTSELMLERLQKHNIVILKGEIEDLYEDIVIEIRQALEMANVYSDILSGMMDAFASIISNNLNITIKFLTSMTIILIIPGTIGTFYGMNVKLPLQGHPQGFLFIILISIVLSIAAVLVFIRKRWL
ncbi:MAG: hypothetical protein JW807_14980 [Spirochaetes bacterium]|nr:hypothetical protein [Spirochaetota bacterium]